MALAFHNFITIQHRNRPFKRDSIPVHIDGEHDRNERLHLRYTEHDGHNGQCLHATAHRTTHGPLPDGTHLCLSRLCITMLVAIRPDAFTAGQ